MLRLESLARYQSAWTPAGFLLLAAGLGLALATLPLPFAGGLVLGTAVILLVLVQPLVGLALALLAGPLGALESVALGSGSLDSGQILLLLTLAAWLARGLRRRRVALPRTALNGPFVLFLGVTAVSLLDAPSLAFGLRELVKWLEMLLVMWLVVDLSGGRPWAIRAIVAMLLLAGLSQALVGVWQFALRGDGPEHFLILDRFYRAYGTFEQPNPFGGYMNLNATLGLGALVGLAMTAVRRRRMADAPWILFVAVAAALTTLALVFSWSRGAWLGFGAALAVAAFFFARRRWRGAALVAVAIGGALLLWQIGLLPPSVTGRLSGFTADFRLGDVRGVDINDANYAVLERLAHWQAALEMARENVWLGVGFGNYEPAYANYALINWPYPLGHAHNYYLNLLAEVGVLGLIAYGIFWTAVIWQTIRLLRWLDWPERGLALGLLAAWASLAVHHLVDKLYVNNIYVHMGAMFGLLMLLTSGSDVENHKDLPRIVLESNDDQ